MSWLSNLNHVDEASALITADSAAPAFPATNLAKTGGFKDFYRSTSHAVVIDFDFGANVSTQILAWYFGRYDSIAKRGQFLSISGTDTIRYKLDADGGTLGAGVAYDSTALASGVDPAYGYAGIKLNAPVTHRYLRAIITGTSRNAPATDFLDIARAWFGPVFSFKYNFSYGANYKWNSGSQISRAERLPSNWVDKGARYRTFALQYNAVHADDRAAWIEFERLSGDDEQLLFSLEDATVDLPTNMMLSRVTQAAGLAEPAFQLFSKSLNLDEWL